MSDWSKYAQSKHNCKGESDIRVWYIFNFFLAKDNLWLTKRDFIEREDVVQKYKINIQLPELNNIP